jgi:hypothetical protein
VVLDNNEIMARNNGAQPFYQNDGAICCYAVQVAAGWYRYYSEANMPAANIFWRWIRSLPEEIRVN